MRGEVKDMAAEVELNRGKSAATAIPLPPTRRKGAGVRAWLVVPANGGSHLEEVGKHSIMQRTGLRARDLRILDPVLSSPTTIFGRERAIVINLEHIKAIITAAEVLVPNSRDPCAASFVRDLKCRVSSCVEVPPLGQSVMHETKNGDIGAQQDLPKLGGPKALPFEFRALEVCLESARTCLESETSKLEQEAYPTLDELTSKISTLNLQRVRHIKNRLVALCGRVQKVRDELEYLLDDETDMAGMYLTEKLVSQQHNEITTKDEAENSNPLSDDSDEDINSNRSSSGSLTGYEPDTRELEMLLESYFVQTEGTLNKLLALREYVDDTEDYINIILDDKQNQLLQMGVVLSTGNLVLNAGIVVVGIFGMNITISLFKSKEMKFWITVVGVIIGCMVLYLVSIHWCKKKGLIEY